MPIYDYRCRECDTISEMLVKSPTIVPRCRMCGGGTDRLLSTPHVHLPPASGFPGKDMKWVKDHERAGRSPQSE